MLTKIKKYLQNKDDMYEQKRIQRISEAIRVLPDLVPDKRYCGKCGKEMNGTFTDAEFFQFHGKLGVPIYYMTVAYTCSCGNKTNYKQGVNNYEGY